ncbi:LysE family translocator [Saccharopolyspora sp. ASAGF58]|uniref:LysE family translocator n=1 Tax=Saccharopolyspora sp. ASAGF58 TaxID=2719023 RepID=UPI00143FE1BA|nr:LysE family translocator [Saccharopolyspora sp. ASAGF58]QIZ36484.1 LysE family translocator [Saccharopolyspora sp. ASAGF58]
MFDVATLTGFFAAAAAIVLLPGPGQTLVLARVASGGRRAGVVTTLGLNTGTLLHAAAAAAGLSAVLATSATAFTTVKIAGAVYLVWLGIAAWRSGGEDEHVVAARARPGRLYPGALVTGVLNPKVAVFFLAFLPQFAHPENGWVFGQFTVLGALLATLSVLWDCALSTTAGAMSKKLAGNARFARWRQRITATVLIGLGIRMALTEQR